MGNTLGFIRSMLVPSKPTWTPDKMPDLTGKVVLVTGANTGIGKEIAKGLLLKNAKVYIACRSAEKAQQAISDLKAQTQKEAIFLALDLASFASIRHAAAEFLSKEQVLDILFDNAGVMSPPKNLLTTEGYDLQFGTAVVGHFLLTQLLMPAILAAAERSASHQARIVVTSSNGAYLNNLHFDTFVAGPARDKFSGSALNLYFQSKYGQVVWARELARRYGDRGVVTTSLHPGGIDSDLARHSGPIAKRLAKILLRPPEHGAIPPLWAGAAPESAGLNGKYLIPYNRVARFPKGSDDPQLGEKLWTWLEAQVKTK